MMMVNGLWAFERAVTHRNANIHETLFCKVFYSYAAHAHRFICTDNGFFFKRFFFIFIFIAC